MTAVPFKAVPKPDLKEDEAASPTATARPARTDLFAPPLCWSPLAHPAHAPLSVPSHRSRGAMIPASIPASVPAFIPAFIPASIPLPLCRAEVSIILCFPRRPIPPGHTRP